ncbi:MAG: PHP domain-containing protein [Candidatus Aenigmarchaeota archaeon]|nr:PHP domain-containing protein [Candidatus Aenigmarchaeota archaeon]
MIDLHTHTHFSDGRFSPEELVDLAVARGIKAISITDHDTIDGIQPAIDYTKAKSLDIKIIPGIEISCDCSEKGFGEVHILGLYIDYNNPELIEFSETIKELRKMQKMKIIKKLQEAGFDITYEEVEKSVKGSFGRPHIARVLVKKYPERFSTSKAVFDEYIGANRPAYVDRQNRFSIKQAIELIKKAGGIPILAHSAMYKKEDSIELIRIFKALGGIGIETYYPYDIIFPDLKINNRENTELISFYSKTAEDFGMLESGGSDFHGGSRNTLGILEIPDSILAKLELYLQTR